MKYSEAAAQLEIGEDDVKGMRKMLLEEGKHWTKKNGAVDILPAGVERMREHLAACVTEKKDEPTSEPPAVIDAPPAPVAAQPEGLEATVYRSASVGNPVLIVAKRGGRELKVRVRAGHKHLFVERRPPAEPQKIHLLHMQGEFYKVARLPRGRGRDA